MIKMVQRHYIGLLHHNDAWKCYDFARVSSYSYNNRYIGFRFYTDSTYTRYYEILFILSASDVIGFDYWDNGSRIMYWRIYK